MFVSEKMKFPTGTRREIPRFAAVPYATEALEERYELDVLKEEPPGLTEIPVIPFSKAMSTRQVNYPLEDLGLGKIDWKKWRRAAGQMVLGAAVGCATGSVGGTYGCLAGAAAGTYFGYNRRRKPLTIRHTLPTAGYAAAAGGLVGAAVGYYKNEGLWTPQRPGSVAAANPLNRSMTEMKLAPGQSIRTDARGQQYIVQGRVTDYSDLARGMVDPEAVRDKYNRYVFGSPEVLTPAEQSMLRVDAENYARTGRDLTFPDLPNLPESVTGNVVVSRGPTGGVIVERVDPKTGQLTKEPITTESWPKIAKDISAMYLQVEAQKEASQGGQGPAGPDWGGGGYGPAGFGPGAGIPPSAGELMPMPSAQGPMVMTADPMTGSPQGALLMRMDPTATNVPYGPAFPIQDTAPAGLYPTVPTAETPWLTYALIAGGVVVAVIVGRKIWMKKGRKAK